MDKIISRGDLFGEIGCLYGCPRTSSVDSTNYTILGLLNGKHLRMICSDNPAFKILLQQHVYIYADDHKQFMFNAFSKVSFLKNLDAHLFHLIMF